MKAENSPVEFPIILSSFPQPGIATEFSQLFDQITVEEQIAPGVFRYFGVSEDSRAVIVIGNNQEIITAVLIWVKPVPPDSIELLVNFILGFLICFCPGPSTDDYAGLTNGILDIGNNSDQNSYYEQFIGQKRIGLTIEDHRCVITIDGAESPQDQVSAISPDLADKMSLLDNTLSADDIHVPQKAVPDKTGEIDLKLSLLEDAFKSGLLTEAEFNEKRAGLVGQTTVLSKLEEAFRIGILTEAEFIRKKAEFTGQAKEDYPDQFPIVVNAFPQPHPNPDPETSNDFLQLFPRITIEEQVQPGIYRYVGVSQEGPCVTVVGNDQEMVRAVLVWARPTSEAMGNMATAFTIAFVMYFCTGLYENDLHELIHWVVDQGSFPAGWVQDKVIGRKRIEVETKYLSCQLTIEKL